MRHEFPPNVVERFSLSPTLTSYNQYEHEWNLNKADFAPSSGPVQVFVAKLFFALL
jgi:hypothetical protein